MLTWSNIDIVLLDMDGTLLDLHFDNYFWLQYLPEKYAQQRSIPISGARILLTEMSKALQGSLNWYCVDYWSDTLEIDIESLKAELSHLICFRPQAVEFLNFLKKLDKELILVTNAHPKSLKIKTRASGLDLHLDRMVSSHEFALAKENSGFWSKLEVREKLDLSRCLFIDDSVPVLERAQQEGVGAVLQILQPDSKQAPTEPGKLPGIINFSELMLV